MGLFNRMKEPVFLKESSDAELQLEKLKTLEPLLNEEGKNVIMRANCDYTGNWSGKIERIERSGGSI